MINTDKPFNVHDYKEIFLRRVWFFIIPFVVILAGTGIYVFGLPKEYRATTLILVTPQKVPEDFVRPTVTSKIEDRLQSIGQEIMSRTRLEEVINEFNLYLEERKSLRLEEIVESMKKNIQVEIKGKEGYFTISCTGKDPKVITLVTNKLALLFIEENLKMREQQAQGTSEFLAIELNATKVKLEEQEKDLTDFKRKFMGELPEQRDANLRVLDQLQMQSQRINDGLKGAQDRRVIIQKQLSDFEMLAQSANQAQSSTGELFIGGPSSSSTTRAKNHYETQLEQMKDYLVELQAKYTDKHPDISITRKKIVDLEAKKTEFEAASKAEAEKEEQEKPTAKQSLSAKTPPGKREIKMDPRLAPHYKEIENQLIAVDMEIKRFKQEDATVRTQIVRYRERIENTPSREQAMALLTRDYSNTRESYGSLLKKSQDAQQAENLERRQKGEQFKIIDPARIPEKPYKPDIPKILLIGLALGLGTGVAAVFFREQMDGSFRDAEDLYATFGFKVLTNIPRIGAKRVNSLRDAAPPFPEAGEGEGGEDGSLAAEQFRKLRSQLLRLRLSQPPRTILVTSATAGEGKTLVSANLAARIAYDLNAYALLVDCDFRKPSLGQWFSLNNGYGLADYLIGKKEIPEILLTTKVERLKVLPAGTMQDNPTELIGSAKMQALIQEFKSRYNDRYIILDSTPLLSTSESEVLSRFVDGIVIVVRAGVTPRETLNQAISSLEEEKILGFALNDLEFKSSALSSRYFGSDYSYYGYGYKKRKKQE